MALLVETTNGQASVLGVLGAASTAAPTNTVTLTAGMTMVVVRKLTIASGKKITLGLGARLRIL